MTRSIKGKSAIVTGAGSGINLEFARVLLREGCNVLIGDIALRPEAQKLIDEYSSGNDGPKALYQKTDVSSWRDLTSLFKAAEEHFGSFDIVCPGAGVFEPKWSGFWNPPGSDLSRDDPMGDHFKSLEVNLTHPIRSTQLAISHYLKSATTANSGVAPGDLKLVVHISSIAGEMAISPVPLYHASKWGLRGFIYSLAEIEEARNIRIAGVAPAIVRTPIWLDAEDKARMITTTEGNEQDDWTTPEEVAEVMLKICTDNEIKNSKGELIPLRGGSLIEVVHEDIRNVPMFGNEAPGSGTDMKGLTMINHIEAWKDMNAVVEKPGWGKV